MLAITDIELETLPDCGDFILCSRCGERHRIIWGIETLPDGTRQETRTLGAVRCGGKSILAAINGKRLSLPGGV